MKKNRTKQIALSVALWSLSLLAFSVSYRLLFTIEPREQYVGNSMILWDGKMTRCGLNEKVDALSMYCRGYQEGYEWGGQQASMFCGLEMDNPSTP